MPAVPGAFPLMDVSLGLGLVQPHPLDYSSPFSSESR
jgi:hypothetical protein